MDNEILLQILNELKELKANQSETNQRLDRIETKLDTVHNQTARTCEDVSQIKTAVVKGEEAYNFMQGIKNVLSPKG